MANGYPWSVAHRDVETEAAPPGGGIEVFDTTDAAVINRARLLHLDSLGLPLSDRRVLDVGCGVGHLAQYFVGRRCQVLCVDARGANIDSLQARYPGLEARVLDVEREALAGLGSFDVVFCYGLLYHLENPLAALRNMASVCGELLLIETLVCDSPHPATVLADEPRVHNQALRLIGNRPSPSFVLMALDRVGFGNVYVPVSAPDHPDFQFDWRGDLSIARGPHNLRCVFVGSRSRLANPRLRPVLEAE